MPDDLWIEGMQALQAPWSLSAAPPFDYKTPHKTPRLGHTVLRALAAVTPLPGKAIKLFFSTSPKLCLWDSIQCQYTEVKFQYQAHKSQLTSTSHSSEASAAAALQHWSKLLPSHALLPLELRCKERKAETLLSSSTDMKAMASSLHPCFSHTNTESLAAGKAKC